MARVNVYLPDDLARAARDAGLNVSRLTQDAVVGALAAADTDRWLSNLPPTPGRGITHDDAMAILDAVRDELGTVDG